MFPPAFSLRFTHCKIPQTLNWIIFNFGNHLHRTDFYISTFIKEEKRPEVMSFVQTVYRGVFRRTSTFVLACVGGAFFFERGFDVATNKIFENMNQGKLWKHIKDKYCEE